MNFSLCLVSQFVQFNPSVWYKIKCNHQFFKCLFHIVIYDLTFTQSFKKVRLSWFSRNLNQNLIISRPLAGGFWKRLFRDQRLNHRFGCKVWRQEKHAYLIRKFCNQKTADSNKIFQTSYLKFRKFNNILAGTQKYGQMARK